MTFKFFISLIIFSGIIFINVAKAGNEPIILDKLLREALQNNPQLKSYLSAARADSSRIPRLASLPDPVFSLNLMNLPVDDFVFDREAMSGKQFALMQKFPFPGKLNLQESIAQKNAEISTAQYREFKNQLARDIKTLYYDLYFVDQSILTTKKNQRLLQEFAEVAETKYSVGKGLQQDVLKARVELSRMIERLIRLKQNRQKLEAAMNALLNRPAVRPLGPTVDPEIKMLPVDRTLWEKQVRDRRPIIAAWKTRIVQSKDQLALSKKNYWPDFSLSLAYTQRDVLQSGAGGTDFFSAGLSMNLPVYFWRKQKKAVEESAIRIKQTEQRFQDIRNRVLTELDNTLSELNRNAELLELYRTGIIPQAGQALESAMIAYQTDKVDFLTLVSNQMTLFNLELEYKRIKSNYQKNLARLEFVTGMKIQ